MKAAEQHFPVVIIMLYRSVQNSSIYRDLLSL